MSNNKNFVVKNGLDVGLNLTANNVTANTFIGALTGNASTATTLATSRTISLGGDLSGSASFNGSADVTITATVADDSHNHVISNIDGLQTELNGKLDSSDIGTTVLAYDANLQSFVTAFTLPTTDGANNQVLTTDGAGNITFADISNPLELYAENPSSPTPPSATGSNAVAIGTQSEALGTSSIAIGEDCRAASGTFRAVAIGSNTNAFGNDASVFGAIASASANESTALGFRANTFGGAGSIAIGESRASGINSFAAAITTNSSAYGATGDNSIAIGSLARATAIYNVAIGREAIADGGANAVAIGRRADAGGAGSLALGLDSDASGFNSVALTNSYASGTDSLAAAVGSSSPVYGAQHNNAVALGYQATTTAEKQIALGSSTAQVKVSGAYTLPTTDGTSGQVLTTDGSGTVTFADISNPLELYAENPDSPTAPSATGTNAVAIGDGATADGQDAIAIGTGADAATFSVSIGPGADAGGAPNTVAIGRIGNSTYSPQSVVIGFGASTAAYTNSQVAIGFDAKTGAEGAVAFSESYAGGADSFAAAITNDIATYGATGANSIAIGDRAKATSNDSFCIANASTASNTGASVMGGQNNTASGNLATTIGGGSNTANGDRSVAYGYYGDTNGILGKVAHGIGPSRQNGMYGLAIDTADATPKQLVTDYFFAGNSTNQIILPNNSAHAFHGTIVARQQASQGTACAAWKIEGLIRREGSAGTTVLVNSATTVLDNTPAWGMALSADTTNGGLKIEVTGAAATNIRWVATVHTSEVTY